MCRIAGRISLEKNKDFTKELSVMLKALAHGGPDDVGMFMEDHVALGHRRLSIIDLSSAGHQPMLTGDSQCVISFNGEIYNYQSLRKEMEDLGASFNTKTDTEVILQAYQHWGTSSFDRLQGIFAFALYDKKDQTFFLVRDHIGVKPLYYFLNDKELIFASEVRAFKALKNDWPEDENWKILFLAFGSLPYPVTTLANVYQLSPATYLKLDIKSFTHQLNHFYIPETKKPVIDNSEDALKLMRVATREALQKNLISDAPLGIFLSGGIDSSLLTLLADQVQENVKTISVNFDDASFDERPFQKLVLEKTKHVEHTSYTVTEQMFWDQLPDIWNAMDQPSVDGVNSYFISLCAKNKGLKTVLSGLGADELFGGYASMTRIKWLKLLRFLPFKKLISNAMGFANRSFKRIAFLKIDGAVGDYLFLRGIHTPDSIALLLNIPERKVWQVLGEIHVEVPAFIDDRQYVSFLETEIYMTNQLLKDTDYMSMWHSLEVRVPFLDIELERKVASIEPSIRYKSNWPKYLLTGSNSDILPSEIIFREKKGFTFPFSLWIKHNIKGFGALLPKGEEVTKIINEFEKGGCHWSKYWSLAVLKQFK